VFASAASSADPGSKYAAAHNGEPGVRPLRTLLDRDTFVLSDEELERLFLPLALESDLPLPKTKEMVNGFEVDFFWPTMKLVVETDGLRYHRTPPTRPPATPACASAITRSGTSPTTSGAYSEAL